MKSFLLSDNRDTLVGMDMAGIEGLVLNDPNQVVKKLKELRVSKDIGIIIITEKISEMAKDLVSDMKIAKGTPLLVEIPDRYGTRRGDDYLLRYIKDAIGLKL